MTSLNVAEIEKRVKKELFDWIQKRIDYWEGVVEKHPNDYEELDDIGIAWHKGLERGEDRGILDGLYQVQEFLTGQRK